MKIRAFAIVVAIFLTGQAALAGIIPGRWDKVDRLGGTGTAIIIYLGSGEKLEATLVKSGPDNLVLRTPEGMEREVPKAAVQRVTRAEKSRDSLKNGLLIGTGVGFAVGFLGHAALNAHATASGPIWDGEAVGYYAGSGLLGGLIGALTGMGIDSAIKSQEELYRAR